MDHPLNVLFLCTGNSCRSVMAEAILNHMGSEHFRAYSAGSKPRGVVHPMTLKVLQHVGYDTAAYRSKSWDEFTQPGAPQIDLVITVCDRAAAETCPIWPGHPTTAAWHFRDPADAQGSDDEVFKAFDAIFLEISQRIRLFLDLPQEKIDKMALRQHANELQAHAELDKG